VTKRAAHGSKLEPECAQRHHAVREGPDAPVGVLEELGLPETVVLHAYAPVGRVPEQGHGRDQLTHVGLRVPLELARQGEEPRLAGQRRTVRPQEARGVQRVLGREGETTPPFLVEGRTEALHGQLEPGEVHGAEGADPELGRRDEERREEASEGFARLVGGGKPSTGRRAP
jgi:hypothetical protein